ncbi:MAG: ABC transporter permease subunit [Chloroflexota bacterium]|nr:ABC transporter permease subunit [Chloroflexota bacterium]
MNPTSLRLLRIPLSIAAVWAALAFVVPDLMSRYAPYVTRPGFTCARTTIFTATGPVLPPGSCRHLSDLYGVPFNELFIDSAFRSLALLSGAAVLALTLGTLLGVAGGFWRQRAYVSGGIVGATTLLMAVPSFFVAYFLQIGVIAIGASKDTRDHLLPVYGFGYDDHIVLPLIAISLPAIAYTAQLTATRLAEVLDADFITAARAKGLRMSWILVVHALPHVRPVILEALGSGLRVSVASLPIVEYLFLWRGIGQLALEAVGVQDIAGFTFPAIIFATLFVALSALADLSRPKALYRTA